MSWALTATGVMAGGSLLASSEANKTASSNAAATAESLLQNFNVTKNSILEKADEYKKQIGMELTQNQLEGLKAEATTSNVNVERGIAGATAGRMIDNVEMQETLLSNQIKQKAEANMMEIQSELDNSKYSYEAGSMQNAIELSNNTTSTVGMITGAISAGAQGYSMGSQIGTGSTTTTTKSPELTVNGTTGGVSTLGSFRQLGGV